VPQEEREGKAYREREIDHRSQERVNQKKKSMNLE
jgi:hypothetical protein